MAELAIFLCLLLFKSVESVNSNETGYILTLPRILQAGAKERFCLMFHDGPLEYSTFTLRLTHQDTEIQDTYELWTDEGGCEEFAIPNKVGTYTVSLVHDDKLLQEMEVEVRGQNLITFIQTDKPMYKPGQKVNYRIMTMKRDLKPRVGKITEVFIKDPNEIRVKQWLDIDSDGLSSFEFQLAAEPKLGDWTIEANIDNELTKQTFKVAEYVLPKFEVTINPPKYLLANVSNVEGEICANYTYGQPVKGFLSAEICLGGLRTFSSCAKIDEEIDGCYKFSVSGSDVGFRPDSYLYRSKLKISASVTERNTGIEVKKSHTGPSVSFDPLKITLEDDTNNHFKPSFPYRGRAVITKPDGSPAPGEVIEISMINYKNDIRLARNFTSDKDGLIHFSTCDPITTNTSKFRIEARGVNYAANDFSPPSYRIYMPRGFNTVKQWFSPSLSHIQIPRRMKDAVKCGEEITFDIPYTTTLDSYTVFNFQVMSRGRIIHTGHMEHHFLKHDSMAVLEVPEEECLIREIAKPVSPPPPPVVVPVYLDNVKTTTTRKPQQRVEEMVPTEGDYQSETAENVEGKRKQVVEEEIKQEIFEPLNAPIRRKRSMIMPDMTNAEEIPVKMSENPSTHVSHVKIKFVVTPEMSPKASLLVYYVRADGETVADSIQFDVEPCFRNKVSMEFTEEQVLPGATTGIKLEAAPGSLCSIGIVDKSVNILGGDHQITPEKLLKKLDEFSVSRYGYNYFSDKDYCEKKLEGRKENEGPEMYQFGWFESQYSSNYVDAVQAFKSMGLLVMTNLVLETRPCSVSRITPQFYAYDGDGPLPALGTLETSVPQIALSSIPSPSVKSTAQSENVRRFFPETWLWQLERIGEDGQLIIMEAAPHTVTKWIGNTICTSKEVGFGFAPVTSLTTFQPFFLSFSLPYSAIRGERLPIRITVFNYLDKCVMMQMNIQVSDDEIVIVHGESNNAPFCLCGGQSNTKKYYIIPEEIGHLPITASAEIVPGLCDNSVEMDTQYIGRSDTAQRNISVKSEGVLQEFSYSKYICPNDAEQIEDFDIPIPDDIVLDSARGEIAVIGDIMGPALSNLDSLISQPTGCGEQTMVKFTPNIYILKYLSSVQQNTDAIETLAKHYMEIGYQRELTFRHDDGSYSAFGKSDASGSTWLTAFVVQSFAQAKDYIYIDSQDLEKSVTFLMSTQLENGCFREVGKVFSSYMMGGLSKTSSEADITAITAYVIISLLEANISKDNSALTMAMKCLNLQENTDDTYTKAIVAYANVLFDADSDHSKRTMEALNEKAIVDGSLKHWGRKKVEPKPENYFHFNVPSAEVEMTAYAMLASMLFYEENGVGAYLPIAMWMSKQRNAFGGYASTQDTVVGLHALSEFATILHVDNEEGNVTEGLTIYLSGDDLQSVVKINTDNSLLLQKVKLTQLPNIVRAKAAGAGCALVQANVRYNKQPEDLDNDEPLFNLTVKTSRPDNDCSVKRLKICVSYTKKDGNTDGMSLITVSMVTGWSPVTQSLKKLRSMFSMLSLKKYEISDEDGSISFYFDKLDNRNRCFTFDVQQNKDLAVSAPKPATVQVFQYYEKEITTVKSYELKTICGTKAEIPRGPPVDEIQIDPFLQRRIEEVPIFVREPGPAREFNSKNSCPVCTDSPPEDLLNLVCQSGAVLKALAGRNGKVSMKVKSDLKPKRKLRIDEFVSVEMEESCTCNLINPPKKSKKVKRVLIFTEKSIMEATNEKEKKIILDSKSHVVNLDLDKSLERQVRLMSKNCRKRQQP
ncbi:alpha-1-macroglobulin isoform X3 [Patella vulgata]|uniref:alpha-1-macroglobulin isoform X3 n=1 Tax=Patella vulgata TaxID=6465 RepID=UPI00217FA707|nr:alpha-1-macroglobulin isoform X3 [Patella vulgata]